MHANTHVQVGYAWMKDSCRTCKNCVRGNESICLKGYTGLITGGEHFA